MNETTTEREVPMDSYTISGTFTATIPVYEGMEAESEAMWLSTLLLKFSNEGEADSALRSMLREADYLTVKVEASASSSVEDHEEGEGV